MMKPPMAEAKKERNCAVVEADNVSSLSYFDSLFKPAAAAAGFLPQRGWTDADTNPDVIIVDASRGADVDAYPLKFLQSTTAAIIVVNSLSEPPDELLKAIPCQEDVRFDFREPGWDRKLIEELTKILRSMFVELVETGTARPKRRSRPEDSSAPEIWLVQIGAMRMQDGVTSAGDRVNSGAMACFNDANKRGGVNGCQINLLAFNDRYDPDLAERHVRTWLGKALAFFSCVGTPTSARIMPIIVGRKIPFFGAYTGADFLRKKHEKKTEDHYIVNVRGSYRAETKKLIEYAKTQACTSVFCFYQDDEYGKSVRDNTKHWVTEEGLTYAGEGAYKRGSNDVSAAVTGLLHSKAEAVVYGGVWDACSNAIIAAKNAGLENMHHLCVSFVGPSSTCRRLGLKYEKHVVFSEVVPSPWASSLPIVQEYRNLVSEQDVAFESLEGFVNAKIFVEIARRVHGDLTRPAFMEAVNGFGFQDIGGLKVNYDEFDHNGLDYIGLFRIVDGKFVEVNGGGT